MRIYVCIHIMYYKSNQNKQNKTNEIYICMYIYTCLYIWNSTLGAQREDVVSEGASGLCRVGHRYMSSRMIAPKRSAANFIYVT